MSARLIIRADGGPTLGLGHLRRCLLLADALRPLPVAFATTGESSLISEAGYEVLPLAAATSMELLKVLTADTKCVVFDVTQRESFAQIYTFKPLLYALRGLHRRTVLIDGLGEDSLNDAADDLHADVTVIPYVGAMGAPWGRWLTGPEWFILPPAYAAPKEPREKCERLLVTAGGSDPTNITMLVLDALTLVPRSLDIRLIVGPFFAPVLRALLQQTSDPRVTLIEAPASLLEHFHWCDAAITATGLTKYELAATGTPALHISLDARHARLNAAFAATGCALDAGPVESLTPAALAPFIERLCDDAPARLTMARCGRALIDGGGAARLAAVLAQLC